MKSILRKFEHSKDRESSDETKTLIALQNGKSVFKELIAASNGKYNPFRIFSAQQLKIATNNYETQKIIKEDGFYKLYKGFWKERSVSVMKFTGEGGDLYEYCINNIVYVSQMSRSHILRLIGCCLETPIPILVFECVQPGTLGDRIFNPGQPHFEPLQLKNRLKIAMEIAHAVAYLHVGFPRAVIFGDIKLSNILFTEQNIVKLFDFSLSKSIPEGETHIKEDALSGTFGYIAPECLYEYNEKRDVYSFGVVLLELLTGQKVNDLIRTVNDEGESLVDHVKGCIENNRFHEITDPIIFEDRSWQQLEAFGQLALQCISISPEDRPTMVDVTKQLRQIYRSCM